jgi:hypothetical protein
VLLFAALAATGRDLGNRRHVEHSRGLVLACRVWRPEASQGGGIFTLEVTNLDPFERGATRSRSR